jgi:hypothetical protein
MILLKMAGALSYPAEHDDDFSVRYKKWCPSCRAIDQNVAPRKTLKQCFLGVTFSSIALHGGHHFYNV